MTLKTESLCYFMLLLAAYTNESETSLLKFIFFSLCNLLQVIVMHRLKKLIIT
jgi:hypothetical protein